MRLTTLLFSLFGKPLTFGIRLKSLKRIICRLKALTRIIKANYKLKKSGYENWARYRHNRDPNVNRYATHLDEFYEGYPYIYSIKDYGHFAYRVLYNYGPGGTRYGYEEINEWLDEKIRLNYRVDIHRVWINQWGKAELNDIGGSDIIYFAFKYEKDFTHFLLRWA